jgi:3-hydroxybutyryl-CoA dehydrogenase
MGAEIALVFALAGKTVFLHDREQALIDRGLERLGALIQKAVDSGRYLPEARTALDRIVAAPDLGAFAEVDMVTEAIFEDEDVKASLWRRLDELCDPRCIFATNTSTIPISTLASKLSADRRRRFVGTHYFSPVSRMALVEVIAGFETEAEVVDATMAIMTSIGKTPIHVKDVAGFAVNRMLHAFIIEAVRLVEEGVATPEDLDTACRLGLGHPIGPFALMDVVTSSLCVQAQEIMQEAYGERFRPPPLLKQRVRAGLAGGKGRPGWLA